MGPRVFIASLVYFVCFSPLSGQLNTVDVSGTVLDPTGAVLPGVTVRLTSLRTGVVLATLSNQEGRYLFSTVPAGPYEVSAELQGFATAVVKDLVFYGGTKPDIRIVLRPAGPGESVTVVEEAPLVETTTPQVGQTVDERQIEDLPLVGRDYLDLVTIVSGVSDVANSIPGSTVIGAKSQNINGAYSRYTSYQLDGFSNTRDIHGVVKVDLALDSIAEFRVITNQFSAEYGQSMAGIISAITKSGGNDFHGSFGLYHRPGGLSADDPLTGKETTFERTDVTATFSGPILRNKTHFFTSFERRDQSEDAVVTAPIDGGKYQGVFPLNGDVTRFLFKLDHQIGDRHHLSGKLIVNDETIECCVGGLDIEANKRDNINDDKAGYFTLRSALSGRLVNELRFSYIDENYQSVAKQDPPFGAVLVYPGQGNLGTGNARQSGDENGWELGNNTSLLLGAQSLKFGFDIFRIHTVGDLIVFPTGQYNFPPGAGFPYNPSDPSTHPFLYLQGFFSNLPGGITRLDRTELHYQAYVQDDWQVSPNLTLNLGLRWEYEDAVGDKNNVAPRFGFNWDPTGSRTTSLRGGVGMFYNYVFSSVEAFEKFSGPLGFFVAAFSPSDPRLPPFPGHLPGPVAPPEVQLPVGNWYLDAPLYSPDSRKNPFSTHYTLGLQHQFALNWGVSADFAYIRGSDLILPVDLNSPTPFDYTTGQTRTAAAADATRPYGVPGGPIAPGQNSLLPEGYPYQGFRDLYLLRSFGWSNYYALKFNLNKRYADGFSLQANYTWSRATNNGDDFRPGNSLPVRPFDYDGEEGRSATDVPHSFVLNGLWDLPGGFLLTGVVRASSGRTIDPLVGSDLDGDRKTRERPFAEGRILERNSFRSDAFFRTDLSISKIFRFGEDMNLEARAEIFNLTNELNPDSINNVYGPDARNPRPGFLAIQSSHPGRQFQFSVRFRF